MQLQKSEANTNLFSYRPDIDALRGLAVIAVLIYHLNNDWLPGGFVGVDIFFAISGYVVSASILRRESKGLIRDTFEFYKRRIKRLFPALVACILITSLFISLLVWPIETGKFYLTGLHALVGLSNIYLMDITKGYFDIDSSLNPFTHTWSLGVEEQFYLIFPFLLFAIYGKEKQITNKKRTIILFLSFALFIIIAGLITAYKPEWNYYSLGSRIWEMEIGSILFILQSNNHLKIITHNKKTNIIIQLFSIFLIIVTFFVTPNNSLFPFPLAIPVIVGTLLFITCGSSMYANINKAIGKSYLTYVGKTSYSLYLWHWPIFVLFNWTVGLNSILTYFAATSLTILFSLISYYCLEQPIRKSKINQSKVIFGSVLIAIVSVIITVGSLQEVFHDNFYLKRESYIKTTSLERYLVADKVNKNLNLKAIFSNCLANENHPNIDFEHCRRRGIKSISSSPQIFLIGDSHAHSLLPMLEVNNTLINHDLFFFGNQFCPININMTRSISSNLCRLNTDKILKYIEQKANNNSLLIIHSRYSPFFANFVIGNTLSENYKNGIFQLFLTQGHKLLSIKEAALQLEKDFIQLSNRLKSKNISILLLAPIPEHQLHPAQCQFSNPECLTDKQTVLEYRKNTINAMNNAAKVSSNLFVWDTIEQLCPIEKCSHYLDSQLIFSDDNHLSAYGSQLLSPYFEDFLRKHRLLSQNLLDKNIDKLRK
ncbi:acyltransferase [Anabaena cylindrica FACHB-243]|uniref:Acyltransferase 3 n=1 Tax=Anabaena cylindrica (strain ATCC 27899 / PCC 7122) TaxID=272123 RepID=K9ZGM7_ANACC|nr:MULTISPECIES: acyltransferase family protein [Anabaena]AFZ57692.1 acyltransferase 3 [Anabaena cylindrica PCC 7122]AZL96606.1 acyltransferase 3 [Anabaena sp. CCAP 1446/1C]MBD2419395.1 acyltransferase [Anabaena cylindrica FACHB-243]MBY5280601.1 acyltransferase [Anabaena sp. CCAP 1446/1C]MBY5307859.1 acyltransferase [Anabaena sp. CCAP 1446/1C]